MKPRQWMQIAAVASAMGLTGTAIANDMDRTPGVSDGPAAALDKDSSGNASSSTSSDLNTQAAPELNRGGDLSGSAEVNGPNANPLTANPVPDLNAPVDRGSAPGSTRGSTQGSTMTSPRSDVSPGANAPAGGARFGSGSSATTIGGQDRLGNTNSDNFSTWMSDYASQHNGHITRQEFLAQMGERWDQLDTQRQGLTPDEVQGIFSEGSGAPVR